MLYGLLKRCNFADEKQKATISVTLCFRHTGTNMGVDILDIQHWVEDQMSELFSTTKQNISLHIGNIFREGELIKEVVVKDFFTTTIHGAIPGKTQRRMCSISVPH